MTFSFFMLVTELIADFRLTRSEKLVDSFNGAGILETEYFSLMRGLLKDSIWSGPYPNHV